MRVSHRTGDPGYRDDAFSYRVYLDGERVKLWFTADEELGEAWVYLVDKDNRLKRDVNFKLIEKCLTGDVRIEKVG
jgi:hypothetical protein